MPTPTLSWSVADCRRLPLVCGMLLLLVAGCQSNPSGEPLPASAFYQSIPESPGSAIDQPGALPQPQLAPPPPSRQPPPPPPHPASRPTSGPATTMSTQTGDPLGTYLTVGAVLAEVNGSPIYADRIFADIRKALHAKAIELDEPGYRLAAQQLIHQDIMTQIGDELAYSAAQRSLSQEDKTRVDAATERWRQRQITDAGGSLQLARQKAQADGDDFDKMVQRQARRFTIELYREKKIYPRVQVTVQDMRHYYNRNRDSQFTQHAAARFELIKIDPQRSGGREHALQKIQEIRRRALAGEDFAKLARDMDDDPLLRANGGDVGWVDKGAYRLETVEKAVWALQPGQMTDIIDTDGAFYLAKLLAVKQGKIIPFENEQVQENIHQTLRLEQVRQLIAQAEQELRDNAAVWQNPNTQTITMEMAMQKYAQWRQ